MGKKKATVNKSQLIREYLATHPDAQNKAVAGALKKHGVTPQDVSNLKARLKRKGTQKKRRKPTTTTRSQTSDPAVDLAAVEEAAGFIAAVGGIDVAQQALSAATKIVKKLG